MTKKPLEQMLAEQAEMPDEKESTRNFARFLDRWEEIKTAYAKGWSHKRIWQVLHQEGQFTFGYCAFNKYVRKMKQREALIEKEKDKTGREMSPFSRRAAPVGDSVTAIRK
jgi:hypothetical protein